MGKLTDREVSKLKPAEKAYRKPDGGGLYLLVTPSGGKLWRMKYRIDGKEKLLSIGKYPDVSIAEARKRQQEARTQIANSIDPAGIKQAQKAARIAAAANTFEAVAREWHSKKTNFTHNTAKNVMARLERLVFPLIGARPIDAITAPDFLSVLRRVEEQGKLETAHRLRGICSQIMRYAVVTGRAQHDPAGALQGALKPRNVKHMAALTEPKQVAELLRMIDGYTGTLPVACALKIAPYVFVRPGELRTAEWADIDLDAAEWRYTVTKTDTQHIVPLARQVVTILKELHPLTGRGRYVFPSARTGERPMSDNAILAALRRLGIGKDEMTGHGFRAMARTILDEVLGVRPDLIEHQLAHAVRDPNGRAYNRTAHLPERKKMMQQWADYLDKLKAGAEIISLRGNAA
ncbi:integrase arm-type DNA-binding domain-containing protein [Oxalobacter vibrioformis]|uniref:Integrase arm-type DNA-binding domain-containing protein n=1 Tax=Oxalobacter vibrioformis TaxID=933080 RepID=A0A9E9LYC9_9BURK|nr:integrase arm-type DNA-binding domain-containing protein [Oxalobacter vibrioformis]WAW09742.1 integrase arm-type DNA-binding domain-containing protein [Oxalobacter vibrioformis]